MKRPLLVGLIIGILVGVIVGYVLLSFVQYGGIGGNEPTWHQVSTFILAQNNPPLANVDIAYHYPMVYNAETPVFTVGRDFWRVKVETVPYFNYSGNIVYYGPVPMILKVIVPAANASGFPSFASSMALLEPLTYGVRTVTSSPPLFYAWSNTAYGAVKTQFTFTGNGTYLIYAESGTGCFSITVEEYY